MKQETRTDLYTQSEYARLIGKGRSRVNSMIAEGKLNTVKINGGILIKVNRQYGNENKCKYGS